jgi:hypothetical protein
MDTNALLDLWKTDEFPACDEGMILPKEYLASCGNAVAWVRIDKSITLPAEFNFRFSRYVAHCAKCEKCHEV